MKKVVSFILMLGAFQAVSQDFKTDMEKVLSSFIGSTRISYSVKYVLRENHSPGSKIISELNGRFARNKNTFLSTLDSKTTLVTPGEVVVIDRDEKRIHVKKESGAPAPPVDVAGLVELSKKAILKTDRREEPGRIVLYDVTLKPASSPEISHYAIRINTRTWYIESMTLFYKTPLPENEDYRVTGSEIPRFDILFSDVNNGRIAEEEELEASYYYKRLNDKLNPTLNFKGYAIREFF